MLLTTTEYLSKIKTLKNNLDILRPFDKSQLKNLKEWFRIGFICNNNALEGNTLTLQEVKIVVEEWITIWGKTIRELKETINHGQLMKILDDFFLSQQFILSDKMICDLHKILLEGLVEEEQLGNYRNIKIYVSGTQDKFPDPDKINNLMKDYIHKYKSPKNLEDIARIHYDFVKTHPFTDGNWRLARILMNLALVSIWYLPIIISKAVRLEYISSLQGDNFTDRYKFFLWQLHENMKDYYRFLVK